MSEDGIDEGQGTQKDLEEVISLCEEENTQSLCDDMDNLCEDLKHNESTPNNMAPVGQIAQPLNPESPEELDHDEKALKSIPPKKKEKDTNNFESSLEKHDGKEIMATYWLLIIGIALAAIGMFGIIGLRLNIVQIFLLGIDNPFPGIGSVEPRGHITSIIPFTFGIVAICVWGFILGKDEEIDESGGNIVPVEKIASANLLPVEAVGFEHVSSHRYI